MTPNAIRIHRKGPTQYQVNYHDTDTAPPITLATCETRWVADLLADALRTHYLTTAPR